MRLKSGSENLSFPLRTALKLSKQRRILMVKLFFSFAARGPLMQLNATLIFCKSKTHFAYWNKSNCSTETNLNFWQLSSVKMKKRTMRWKRSCITRTTIHLLCSTLPTLTQYWAKLARSACSTNSTLTRDKRAGFRSSDSYNCSGNNPKRNANKPSKASSKPTEAPSTLAFRRRASISSLNSSRNSLRTGSTTFCASQASIFP